MSILELTKIKDLKCERDGCGTGLTFISILVDKGYAFENGSEETHDYVNNYSCCDYVAKRGGQYITSRETLVFACTRCGAYYLVCPFCSEFGEDEVEEETVDGELGVYLCNYAGFNGFFYINENYPQRGGEEREMRRAWIDNPFITKEEWGDGEYFEGDKGKRWVECKWSKDTRLLSGPDGGMSNYWKCMRCNTFMDYGDK
jgi:ferredoxin